MGRGARGDDAVAGLRGGLRRGSELDKLARRGEETIRTLIYAMTPPMRVELEQAVINAYVEQLDEPGLDNQYQRALSNFDEQTLAEWKADVHALYAARELDPETASFETLPEDLKRFIVGTAISFASPSDEDAVELVLDTVLPILSPARVEQLSDECSELYWRDHGAHSN